MTVLELEKRRLIIEHAREAQVEIPKGVVELRAAGCLALRDLGSRKEQELSSDTTLDCIDSRRWRLKGDGWDLQLLDVGVSQVTTDLWKSVESLLLDRPIKFQRLPGGQLLWCHLEKMTVSRQSALLSLRDSSRKLQVVPITNSQLGAVYWENELLEVRARDGVGIALQLCRCDGCGELLNEPDQWKMLDGLDYCPTCYQVESQLLRRETRSRAQRLVGICRGCMYYAVSYEGKSFGLGGKHGVACVNADRVARFGPLKGKVESCNFRRTRARGEERPRIGTLGRLTTEARKSTRTASTADRLTRVNSSGSRSKR